MGGQAPAPQPQPIPMPPFGQQPQPGPAPAPAPAGGMKGGSLAGIPDLATLFNSQSQVFPNSLSFPKQGVGASQIGTPGGPVPGAPAIPAGPAAPQSAFAQLLARIAPQARSLAQIGETEARTSQEWAGAPR